MLGKNQMQEIQDLKLRGYTQAEIIDYYNEQGILKEIDGTVDMDVVFNNIVDILGE